MSSFSKMIDEIIYVLDTNEEELRRGIRTFNHTTYGHKLKDHLKQYLTDKGIKYGVIKNSTLSSIPQNHSSFHQDENDNHHIHSH